MPQHCIAALRISTLAAAFPWEWPPRTTAP
jgi:hypothetical protein